MSCLTRRAQNCDPEGSFSLTAQNSISLLTVQQQGELMLRCLLWALAAAVQPKALQIAHNLCLRQQLVVLQRRKPRPRLENADRRFWIPGPNSCAVQVLRAAILLHYPSQGMAGKKTAAPGPNQRMDRKEVDENSRDLCTNLTRESFRAGLAKTFCRCCNAEPRTDRETYRQIKTGIVLRTNTSAATLPRRSRPSPPRPWEDIMTRSHPLCFAPSMMPSAGALPLMCIAEQRICFSLATSITWFVILAALCSADLSYASMTG